MTEILQIIAVLGLFYGSWKLDAINRTLGRIESRLDSHTDIIEDHKGDIKNHDERLHNLERDRRTDGLRLSGGEVH